MQKQAPTPIRLLTMVAFALSCFGLLLFLWNSFGGPVPLKPKGYRVDVLASEATQLAAQADVRVSGVPIGRVVALRRDGDRTRATLEIKPRYAPLPADTRAVLRQKTLLGETFLELSPGDRARGELRDGATLAARQVQGTVELDEVLGALDAPTRKALQEFVGGLGDGFGDRSEELNAAVGTLPATIEDGGDVLDVAAREHEAVQRLIKDAGTVLETVGARDAATRELVTAGDEVLRTTEGQASDLRATVRALPPFLTALGEAADAAVPLAADAAPSLRALRPVARDLRPTLAGTRALADELTRTARELPAVIRAARTGLPAAREILAKASPLLDRLSPTAAALVPVSHFLNVYRDEFTRSWAQVAAATNDTAKTASGRDAHYLRLTAPVWNEALGIAASRYGTNRANPYPRPGGLERLAEGLEAFGCAHAGNASAVPPIGQPPACRQAPAFRVGDRVAQFPKLTPAPQ